MTHPLNFESISIKFQNLNKRWMIEIEWGDKERETGRKRERERKKKRKREKMQSIRIASNWSRSLNDYLESFLKYLIRNILKSFRKEKLELQ